MCVGKALTGGYMTLAATLCTPAVAEAVSAGEGGGLMHGPTFMANPLACAVALASLDAARATARWRDARSRAIERGLRDGLAPARGAAGRADVRVLGAIGVVELDARSTSPPRPRPRSSAACGCARSASSSTRCRRT